MNEKNTPRDFFLHTGAFVTLYAGAIALITLAFSVINYAFPDELYQSYYYVDPYSGPLRFAIASLIVLTPLLVYLFYVIQGEARRTPERTTLGVRKWLTYITLFVAGVTVVGDVIVLLNSFLGGALPTAFLLKVAALFAVMGAGFSYFFLDIRGYWIAHPEYSRYVGGGVVLFVLSSIVGGMLLIGNPATQRAYRIDNEQVQALDSLSGMILQYWENTATLPENLADLENSLSGYPLPLAPTGQPAYEYRKTAATSFELCATFLRASTEDKRSLYVSEGFVEAPLWNHDEGRTCFERTINTKLFPPKSTSTPIVVPLMR